MDLVNLTESKIRLEGQLKNGANWFLWIAILSIANAFMLVLNLGWSFVFGLGITQIIDYLFFLVTEEIGFNFYNTIGFIINTGICGIFILFSIFANKKQKWAFIAGIILYSIDALLMLVLGDFLSVAFHGFVLYGVIKGMKAMKKLEQIETEINSYREEGILEPDISASASI